LKVFVPDLVMISSELSVWCLYFRLFAGYHFTRWFIYQIIRRIISARWYILNEFKAQFISEELVDICARQDCTTSELWENLWRNQTERDLYRLNTSPLACKLNWRTVIELENSYWTGENWTVIGLEKTEKLLTWEKLNSYWLGENWTVIELENT